VTDRAPDLESSLAEIDRRLRELQRELQMVAGRERVGRGGEEAPEAPRWEARRPPPWSAEVPRPEPPPAWSAEAPRREPPPPPPPPGGTEVTPSSTTITLRTAAGGTVASLAATDEDYFQVAATPFYPTSDWYAEYGGIAPNPTSLSVAWAAKSSASCSGVLYVYNWASGGWTQIATASLGATKTSGTVTVPGTLSNYVSSTGTARVRMTCSGTLFSTFTLSTDRLTVIYS
jgi:hypothetical protein